jgi:hypothetical protein
MCGHVRRSVKMAASGYRAIVGPTKTHQERRASLDAVTLAALDTHRHRVEQWAAEAGVSVGPTPTFSVLIPRDVSQ